jgi:CheY-like chemotaxis protein
VTRANDLPLDAVSVLAVDDDGGALEALTLVLEVRGARVYPVGSAAAALAFHAANAAPDVIVSDVAMRGTDGLTMIATIRAAEAAAHRAPTPAVAVSGYATPQHRQQALAAGYQVYVTKPIDVARLVETIRTLVGRGADTSGPADRSC